MRASENVACVLRVERRLGSNSAARLSTDDVSDSNRPHNRLSGFCAAQRITLSRYLPTLARNDSFCETAFHALLASPSACLMISGQPRPGVLYSSVSASFSSGSAVAGFVGLPVVHRHSPISPV